jgi:hypothetical protein
LPPYAQVFRALSLHLPGLVLSGDPKTAAGQVVDGLRAGVAVCVLDGLGWADGFMARWPQMPVRRLKAGERLTLALPPQELPLQVRVKGAGRLVAVTQAEAILEAQGEGALEVELWAQTRDSLLRRTWKPWIVPSPWHVVP